MIQKYNQVGFGSQSICHFIFSPVVFTVVAWFDESGKYATLTGARLGFTRIF